jgi:uncharacterized protein YdeI (YjbR/CyaY-like superfamily)
MNHGVNSIKENFSLLPCPVFNKNLKLMPTNPAIDSYIAKAQPFAQPILLHLRKLVHLACPNVEEKVKWGMPFFDYKGPMSNMAAFKQHCSFGFWKASLMSDPILLANAQSEVAMGHLGKITSLQDLPKDKQIKAYIKEAMQLNEAGKKVVKAKPAPKADIDMPDYFTEALATNATAKAYFETSSPSCKREYLAWIVDAKSDATRAKRMAQAIEYLSEEKPLNWKYMDKYKKA